MFPTSGSNQEEEDTEEKYNFLNFPNFSTFLISQIFILVYTANGR